MSLPSPTLDTIVNMSCSSGIFSRSSPALLSPNPVKKKSEHALIHNKVKI